MGTFLDTDNKVQNGGNVDEATSKFLNSGEIDQKAGGILSETSNLISSTSEANMTDINNDVNKLVDMLTTESDSNDCKGETFDTISSGTNTEDLENQLRELLGQSGGARKKRSKRKSKKKSKKKSKRKSGGAKKRKSKKKSKRKSKKKSKKKKKKKKKGGVKKKKKKKKK